MFEKCQSRSIIALIHHKKDEREVPTVKKEARQTGTGPGAARQQQGVLLQIHENKQDLTLTIRFRRAWLKHLRRFLRTVLLAALLAIVCKSRPDLKKFFASLLHVPVSMSLTHNEEVKQ